MIAKLFDDEFSCDYHSGLLRPEQIRVFFHFLMQFRDLVEQYETSRSLPTLKNLHFLKHNIKDFVSESLSSLEEDIYEGLLQLQDYIANYIHHKKQGRQN